MGTRPAQQLRRGKAEHVAARFLDVDHFGAELRKLGADIGLGDQLSGADCADTFQWAERRSDTGRLRSHQMQDPTRNSVSKLLDLFLVLDEP
jgi:hypothetical protein